MDKLKKCSLDQLTALSLSIGVLAGVATFLAVGPLSGFFFIWAATIAWAAYFFLGATKEALINTIVCGIFGVFMAWFTAILLTNIPADAALGFPLMAAITVAVAVIVTCLAANIPPSTWKGFLDFIVYAAIAYIGGIGFPLFIGIAGSALSLELWT